MAYHVAPFIKEYYPKYYSLNEYPASECVCIRKTNEEWGILGNFANTPLIVNGVEFCNSEQLYHMMGFTEAEPLNEIFAARGMTIKMKARRLRNEGHLRPDWGQRILDAMKFCLQTKYEQCKEFRDELERSKGKYIVEDESSRKKKSADTWGVILDGNKYKGSNLLGRLLMELRDNGKLENNLPEDAFDFIKLIKTK